MTAPVREGLRLDFGRVISVTLFERHVLSEETLRLLAGTLTWRGPFTPESDNRRQARRARLLGCRGSEVGKLFGED